MVPVRHRLAGLVAILGALIAALGGDVRAQVGGPNTWTTVAPLPEGLLWPAVASAAGKLYAFGGLCPPQGTCNQKIESFDPKTNAWAAQGNMPEAVFGVLSATTAPDGRIYIFALHDATPGATVLVYDPPANTWSQAPAPPGVQEAATLVTGLDGLIYAVGGHANGVTVGTLSAYDPSTHRWTLLAPDPTPRYAPAAAVGPDGRIYVTGGDESSASVDAYDPRSNTWASIASLPTWRDGLQAVTGPDGRIYALGGEGRCITAPCDEVEAYDVHTGIWTAVTPMPHGRSTFVAVTGPDGRIYVLGGFTTPNPVPPTPAATEVDAYTVVPGDQPLPLPPAGPTIATRELAPMPTGRYGLGAAMSGGKIYTIGGQAYVSLQPEDAQQGSRVLRTVEAYDPKTNTWAKEPPLPAPRMGMGVATGPHGRIYVLGGVAVPWAQFPDSGGIVGARTVFIYGPKARRWSRGSPCRTGATRWQP